MGEKVERAEAEALAELRGVKSSAGDDFSSPISSADDEIDAELSHSAHSCCFWPLAV
jgi:hypothetical protein